MLNLFIFYYIICALIMLGYSISSVINDDSYYSKKVIITITIIALIISPIAVPINIGYIINHYK